MVDRTSATSDEGRLARTLYQNGQRLRDNNDPLDEAEAFSDMADLLIPRMEALGRSDKKALKRIGDLLAQVEKVGIQINVEKAQLAENLGAERRKKLQKVLDRDLKRQAELEALLGKLSESDRQAIRNALEASKPPHANARKPTTQQGGGLVPGPVSPKGSR